MEEFNRVSSGSCLKQTLLQHKVEDIESSKNDGNSSHYGEGGTTSSFKTFFNGLNALSGVGILSTPFALASGGWLSLALLFVVAASSFYSGLLIKRSMDFDPHIMTYPDIGERAFGVNGRALISIFMYVELFLVATGFLILEGDNLHNLFPNLHFNLGGLVTTKQGLVILVVLVILPTVWVDNLSLLSYVSASGVLASGIILTSIFWTGAFSEVGFHHEGTFVNWSGIPTAVSLYGFCYCAHPVFPTLYTSMRKKHQFSNVLLLCFILCTAGYASIAVMGYLMFGDEAQSQITLNLPLAKLSSRIAIYTTLVNPICKYALIVTPIVNAAKPWLPTCCYRNKKLLSFMVSTTLVISTVVVAITVPFFGYLMSLVGAFLSVTASIILPCLCYLKISGRYRRLELETVTIVGIILMGITMAIFGTYTSLQQIVRHW